MKPIIEYIKNTSYFLKERPSFKGYTEKHHILPKSLGGTDDESNIIVVPASEHLRLHKLLYLHFGENSKMGIAYSRMAFSGNYELTPEEFQLAREAAAMRGSKNPRFNHEVKNVLVGNKIIPLTRNSLVKLGYSQSQVSLLFSGKIDYLKDCLLTKEDETIPEAKARLQDIKNKARLSRKLKNQVPKAKGKKAARYDHNKYYWFNDKLKAQRYCTMADLGKEFDLPTNKLSRVKNGTRGSYHGWRIRNILVP